MPILELIAHGVDYAVRGAEYCRNAYQNNPRVRAVANTAILYGSMRVAAEIAGAKSSELESMVEMAAPVVAGIYAGRQAQNNQVVQSEAMRSLIQVAVAAVVGWDLADKIVEYRGSNSIINTVQDGYRTFHAYAANKWTNLHEARSTGFLMGLAGGAANRVRQHYQRIRRARNANRP
ncbi:hypothetical protein HY638_05525 [Candidatus Woesearchaeota archaeon]|nr:hypothetical protein [Candidatus Woesearchaeota archaeon]